MERQRRLDERQSNWVSHGLAEFGDILRTHSDHLETMAYAAISGLVRYLDANQGAIYVADDEETQLQMIACHAGRAGRAGKTKHGGLKASEGGGPL
jgi:hypothetical protein